ncbi:TIR domain-containing protein [Altibacter lentus]|uniref:TIR domain-containing protein n=1 Tax=Altibacter lentus TaxID=1223410 RepID=UPI00054F9B52|nr:TIR domain-containing protein [Altibacter lentus]
MYNAFISYSHAADGKLAPALQLALEKFAKPWFKLRNLHIFRDESSLAVTPQLWQNIKNALSESEYLIYLASPRSAASKWVCREIEYWLEHKSLETLLIVLTEGDISWSDSAGSFYSSNNALPEVLQKYFKSEPLYVDLRSFNEQEDVSLANLKFREKVLLLAAQLHGKAPNDMAGVEIREHKRMIRTRNAAILLLSVLFIAAVSAAIIANRNARDLSVQIKLTRDSSRVAQEERDRAQANFLIAEAQLESNPTKALRIASRAYHKRKDSVILSRAYRIYQNNNIYTPLQVSDTLGFPMTVSFISDSSYFIIHHSAKNELLNVSGDNRVRGNVSEEGKKQERFVLRDLTGAEVAQYAPAYKNVFQEKKQQLLEGIRFTVNYSDDRFYLRNKQNNSLLKTLVFYQDGAKEKASFISPDNKKIVSVWNDGAIRMWDIETEFLSVYKTGSLPTIEFGMSMGEAAFLDYSSLISLSTDGKHMVVATDSELQYWDLQNKALINSYLLKDNEFVNCAGFDETSSFIHFNTTTDSSYTWNINEETASRMTKTQSPCNSSDEDTDAQPYKIGGKWKERLFLETASVEPQWVVKSNEPIEAYVRLPKTERILTISNDTLRLYKDPSYDLKRKRFLAPLRKLVKEDPKDDFRKVTFSPDETKMLISFIDYDEMELTYELWDLVAGERMSDFPSIFAMFSSDDPIICFSPDSKKILITYGNRLTVWNCPKPLQEIPLFSKNDN